MMTLKGHCLCGSVRFELDGPHNWVGHCHCESCRRGAGAPLVTWIGHPNGAWHWTGPQPKAYISSPGNTRYFCSNCGSSVAFSTDRFPKEMHFHAALLEDPTAVAPNEIYFAEERLGWMPDHMPGCTND